MNKPKKNKGITLIALIISIIILLILAVVSISAVTGDGIIAKAKQARTSYEQAQEEEQDILKYYESYLSGTVGTWTQEGATLTRINADKTKTQVKIGDYVNYNEGSYTFGTKEPEDLSWRVLGVNEKGELELISADPTTQQLYLANEEGYLNAETTYNEDGSVKKLGTLDKYCNDLYGQGTDNEGNKLATGARSLNVEDINKLTHYDPKTFANYGTIWTYRYPTQEEMDEFTGTENSTRYMQYRIDKADGTQIEDWTNITDTDYQEFRIPGQTTLINSENPGSSEPLECTSYAYDIEENLTTEDGFTAEEATAISNMICKGTTDSYVGQWLASCCISCQPSRARFSIRFLVYGKLTYCSMFESNQDEGRTAFHYRPVVSLKTCTSLTGTGENIGTVENMWQISLDQ